jgi:hypothetical protein
MLFSSIGVFAEGLTVLLNPFPIIVNGINAEIEAYNINGRTFMALGDTAKCFNATAKLNETTKVIEVTTNESEVKNMSTAIKYDSVTGLPIGAEYVENEKDGRMYKTIQYNNKIFISESDMKDIYGIKYIRNLNSLNIVYGNDEQEVTVDFMQRENVLKVNTRGYINIALFNQIIGE